MAKLESPYELVRSAARRSLEEFSFDRYLSAFDMLDDEVRQSTGPMVRRVDPTAAHRLLEEIQARSRTRRLRGIAMAAGMNLGLQLQAAIIDRLSDEDHLVRAEAAKALIQCPTEEARQALKLARHDRSLVVQEAAERSLLEFASESLVDEDFATALAPKHKTNRFLADRAQPRRGRISSAQPTCPSTETYMMPAQLTGRASSAIGRCWRSGFFAIARAAGKSCP